jgi:CheY-like chemotaxis protein
MRALVIDDQREFFESIRPTLKKAGFLSDYAPDLSSARTALTERNFDLVLTDLQMPPGNWGGLDVIRMVRELDRVVPLFVVSGRGSLAECIQAVRLGADDYIQKEAFTTEFSECANSRFTTPYAIEYFPSLVSYLFRLFEEERQIYAKARRLIDVFENTVKLLSLMVMAEQSPRTGGTPIESLLNQWNMERPALGHYVSFLYTSIGGRWDGKLLTSLRASEFAGLRGDCDRLTKCRNEEFGHSTVVSAHEAAQVVERFSSTIRKMLNAVSFLRRFQLFAAESLSYDGTLFTANGKLLRGSNLHHSTGAVTLTIAVPTGHIVVVLDSTVVADLAPLIEVSTSSKGDWGVYKIYDKLGKNGIEYDLIPK